jgi:hypothetical protein
MFLPTGHTQGDETMYTVWTVVVTLIIAVPMTVVIMSAFILSSQISREEERNQ